MPAIVEPLVGEPKTVPLAETGASNLVEMSWDPITRIVGSLGIYTKIDFDAKKVAEGRWEIFTHGGRKRTGIDAVEWAIRMTNYGAGEILLTSMDADGTKAGYDLALVRAIADAVPVPVIASGGVGNLQHLADGIQIGRADAVLAASIFHFGEYTVPQAKAYLRERGIEMREL